MASDTQSPTSDNAADSEHEDVLRSSVGYALEDQECNGVFAIGGKINATDISPANVIIRWDAGEWNQVCRVALPLDDNLASQQAFTKLLEDCKPATFGYGGMKVLDEKYRNSSKMDKIQFCTSFNPYEYGVIDTVVQSLVHGHYYTGMRGVRAELYALNVGLPALFRFLLIP